MNILKLIVLEKPLALNLDQAPIGVGESLSAPSRNLTVDVLSQTGNNYTVRIRYLLPPSAKPDPMIIPWGAPPHETVDIWVDSTRNGFGTYRHADGGGNPTGNRHDPCVNHDNRVYVRIRNIGPTSPEPCASRSSRTNLPAWATQGRTGDFSGRSFSWPSPQAPLLRTV